MYHYPYTDDPEPKERPETKEDKLIKRSKKILNYVLLIAGLFFLGLFIYGIVLRKHL